MKALLLVASLLACVRLPAATSPYAYLVVDDQVEFFNWQTQRFEAQIGLGADGLTLAPDGKHLYASSYHYTTLTSPPGWDLNEISTSTLAVSQITDGGQNLRETVVPYDRPFIYTLVYPHDLEILCAITHVVLGAVGLPEIPNQLAITPDGEYIYAVGETDIQVIRTNPAKLIGTISIPGMSFDPSLALSPDGSLLYVGTFDSQFHHQKLSIFSTVTNSLVAQVDAGALDSYYYALYSLAVAPDGSFVYALNGPDQTGVHSSVAAFSTVTRTVSYFPYSIPNYSYPGQMAITPDGSLLLLTGTFGMLEFAPSTGKIVAQIPLDFVGGSQHNEIVTPKPEPPPGPAIVTLQVLYGSRSYDVIGSKRVRLPWKVSGIRAIFSEPVASAGAGSLIGVPVTGFTGLGTNTLTWTINPVADGNLSLQFLATGPTGIRGDSGRPLTGGRGYQQEIRILTGDFNDDGTVNALDITGLMNAHTQPYNAFADIDGDGTAGDLADINAASANLGVSNR